MKSRIAVVGGGVAGIVASHILSRKHDVTLFESSDRLGGHAHSVEVQDPAGKFFLDTAVLIFNTHTYPNFYKFIDQLGLQHLLQNCPMSIGVHLEKKGLTYGVNTGIRGFFKQPLNLFKPQFISMITEIQRFREDCKTLNFDGNLKEISFQECLKRNRYSDFFAEAFAYPLGASVWSLPRESIMEMPAGQFIGFFSHHNMMRQLHQAKWQTLKGGTQQYLQKFAAGFRGAMRTGQKIQTVEKNESFCTLVTHKGEKEVFDYVVLATPADISLRLLSQPTENEKTLLGPWKYKASDAVLHTHEAVFPKIRSSWPSWNIRSFNLNSSYQVIYALNTIQPIPSAKKYFVSMGELSSVPESTVLKKFRHHHVQFTKETAQVQDRLPELNSGRVLFCGSYFGHGFHEDAVKSAIDVANRFGLDL